MKKLKRSNLKVGDKVQYHPTKHGGKVRNGIVKKIPNYTTNAVSVVYDCKNDWENYKDHYSEMTYLNALKLGWNKELKNG